VAHDTSSWEQFRLYTDRLCLRAPTPQDAEALYDLFADAEVMQGLNRDPVSAVEEARAMIETGIGGWRTDGLGPFIIETTANEQAVGQAGLMIFDTRGWTPSTWANAGSHAQPELGWALIRAHWGHGYATEAAAAIRELVTRLSIHRPAGLSDLGRQRPLSAGRGKTWCGADRNRHSATYEEEAGRLETSARLLMRDARVSFPNTGPGRGPCA
jgi:RimJ/RimL family protein N-acetyltransferase